MDKVSRKLLRNANNKANFAFVGIAIPALGLAVAISAFATLRLIEDDEKYEEEITSIKGRLWLAVALSIVGSLVWYFIISYLHKAPVENSTSDYSQILNDAYSQ